MPLWQTLYTPVADLIYPCDRHHTPLWQTPFFLPFIGIPLYPFYLLLSSLLQPGLASLALLTLLVLGSLHSHFTDLSPKYNAPPCAQVSHFTGYSAAGGLASLAILYYIPQV